MSYPNYTRAERMADAVVHGIGVIGAIVAVTAFFWMWSPLMGWPTFLSVAVYAGALILMLSASAAYHLAAHTAARPILRRLDHAAIYLKIAGTFTPLSVVLGTAFGYAVLGLVWLLALVGAGAKLMAKRGSMTTFWWPQVALGWVGLLLLVPLWSLLPAQSLGLIVAGGMIYTVAVIFYCWESLRYANAIWHAFVLVATGCFFLGISSALAAALQLPPLPG
ncbi:MAG: hemolysin III family protein [Roseovarius sp.]